MLFVALLTVLGACKDSGGSTESFDPSTTGTKVSQAFGAVQANKAVQSFDVMSGAFTFAGATAAFPGAGKFASGAAPTAVLPANVLGKTFGYNTTTAKYQPVDQAGAPSNGVRYLLYAVDTVTRTVVSPLQQIGYLDLTDKSSASSNTIGVTAQVNNVTVLSYDANASISGGSFSYGAKGNVIDGSNRLDFDITQNVGGSGAIQVDYKLTAPTMNNLGVEITLNATSSTAGTSDLMVTDNADKLEIAMTTSGSTSNGTAKFNGTTVANLTAQGNADPSITAAGSRTLSATDMSGLKQLYKTVDLVFSRFDDVLFPSYFVFGVR
jgi:hypothetical protein